MPQDRQVYSELNKTTWSYVPNLVRWRQRYRGPRESQKINQEISQILYDLYQANQRINVLFEQMEDHAAALYSGRDDYDEVEYLYDDADATPNTYAPVGIRNLSERLTRIDNILRNQGI